MTLRPRALAVLAAALLVLAFPGVARAATGSVGDGAHDGTAAAEITGFRITNGAARVTATIRYATLSPAGASAFTYFQVAGTTRYSAGRKAGGTGFFGVFHHDTFEAVRCRGLRTAVLHSPLRVRVVIPQSCLAVHGRISAGGGSESRTGTDLDFTRTTTVARH